MNYDTALIKGDAAKPAVVFVHGLGMDKRIWMSPDEARVLGGSFPVSVLVSGEPEPEAPDGEEQGRLTKGLSFGSPPGNLTTLFHDMKERNFTVLTWSQQRPSAEIDIAVSELSEIITLHEEYCNAGIILIGHSRGGLVARKYLACGDRRIRCLIALATPHRGSRMAQWAGYLSPLSSLLAPFFSDAEKGTLAYTVKHIIEFLSSKAVRELLPASHFFRSLDDRPLDGVSYFSAGGKDPTLFSLYRLVYEESRGKRRIAEVETLFSFPEIFEKLIPDLIFPDEMKKDWGDGLITLESSRLPWAHEHHAYDVNHAGILFDKLVREKVIDFLNRTV